MGDPERNPHIPAWAARERLSDMAWIADHLPNFWPAAQAAYAELGRGALTVDTTSQPTGGGHPFWYLPQDLVRQLGDPAALRIVTEYEPTWEFVTMLLKTRHRVSTYRIGVPDQRLPEESNR